MNESGCAVAALNLAHVARHQFDLGVLKRLAALVVHRDPADEIEQVAVLRRDDVVIGFPSHPAGHVREFGVEFCRLCRCSASRSIVRL